MNLGTPTFCRQCGASLALSPPLRDSCDSDLYKRLSQTNDPVTSADARLVTEELLSGAQEQARRVDERRERLRAIIDELAAEHASLHETIRRCQGLLSPLRGLPLEILTEIFQLSCLDYTNILDPADGPWKLSQVCATWRKAVFATPLLWTRISLVNVPSISGQNLSVRQSRPVLKRILALSGVSKLTVTLVSDIHPATMSDHDASIAVPHQVTKWWLADLIAVSERWKTAELFIGGSMLKLLAGLRGKIPCLRYLAVVANDTIDLQDDTFPGLLDVFEVAPRLRSVKLGNLDTHPFILPLGQLTAVQTIRNISSESYDLRPQLHKYLQACPDLEVLSLTHPFSSHQNTIPPSMSLGPLTSNTLRKLCVSDNRYLDLLVLPRLEELRIKAPVIFSVMGFVQPCPGKMLQSINRLLVRSMCSLKKLCIVDLHNAGELYDDILQLTPELEELKLKYNRWGSEPLYDEELDILCRFLDVKQMQPSVVPKLKSFVVRADSTSTYDMKRTIDFIDEDLTSFLTHRHRRENEVARLETVDILLRFDADIYTLWTAPFLERLRSLKEEGMRISLSTCGGMPPLTDDGKPNLGYTVDSMKKARVYI